MIRENLRVVGQKAPSTPGPPRGAICPRWRDRSQPRAPSILAEEIGVPLPHAPRKLYNCCLSFVFYRSMYEYTRLCVLGADIYDTRYCRASTFHHGGQHAPNPTRNQDSRPVPRRLRGITGAVETISPLSCYRGPVCHAWRGRSAGRRSRRVKIKMWHERTEAVLSLDRCAEPPAAVSVVGLYFVFFVFRKSRHHVDSHDSATDGCPRPAELDRAVVRRIVTF